MAAASGSGGGSSSSSNKLLYACVARGTTVLAEHSFVGGNAPQIALRILEKLPSDDASLRISYAQDRHMYHVLVSGGATFLVMAEDAAGRRAPYAFLEDVAARFSAAHGGGGGMGAAGGSGLPAYALNAEFGPVLAARMEFFGAAGSGGDALGRVRGEISQVKDVMIENIAKVLDRGEKLDLLVDKTELLQGEALAFRRGAARARRVMWWHNARSWLAAAGAVAAVVLVIVMLNCGITLSKCG